MKVVQVRRVDRVYLMEEGASPSNEVNRFRVT